MIILEIPRCRPKTTLKLAGRKIINVKTRQACFIFSTFLNFFCFIPKSRRNPFFFSFFFFLFFLFTQINLAMTEWQRSGNKVSCLHSASKRKSIDILCNSLWSMRIRHAQILVRSHERNTYNVFHKYEKYFRKWFTIWKYSEKNFIW